MAIKKVRTYYSTYIEVELDTNEFKDEDAMLQYVRENACELITPEELYENICMEHTDQEIL